MAAALRFLMRNKGKRKQTDRAKTHGLYRASVFWIRGETFFFLLPKAKCYRIEAKESKAAGARRADDFRGSCAGGRRACEGSPFHSYTLEEGDEAHGQIV